jgi:hypothetical protein
VKYQWTLLLLLIEVSTTDVATLHDAARYGRHRADNNRLAWGRNSETQIKLFYNFERRKELDGGAVVEELVRPRGYPFSSDLTWKAGHKTMSQGKKFANIIVIDNHSEKIITENDYVPGFSIGYDDRILPRKSV